MGHRGVLRTFDASHVAFWCPGCEEFHTIRVRPSPSPSWEWNGDYDKPTFAPSVLIRRGHYVPGQEGKDCWCSYEKRVGEPPSFSCGVCHSFVREGRIEFLGDCTHWLAGKTVPLAAHDLGGD